MAVHESASAATADEVERVAAPARAAGGRALRLREAHRAEVEAAMPEWAPMPARPRRRGLIERILGLGR